MSSQNIDRPGGLHHIQHRLEDYCSVILSKEIFSSYLKQCPSHPDGATQIVPDKLLVQILADWAGFEGIGD